MKLYLIEQKLALRSGDMLLFGVAMPVGVMILINIIAGSKPAGEEFTYLESSFASLIIVGICVAIDTYLKVICFPTFKGHCGCILFDISEIKTCARHYHEI